MSYSPHNKVIFLPPPLQAAIRAFRFAAQIDTQSEAIRRLITLGLEAAGQQQKETGQ